MMMKIIIHVAPSDCQLILFDWLKSSTIDENVKVEYNFNTFCLRKRNHVDARYHCTCSKHSFRS